MSTANITSALMKSVKVANITMLGDLPVRWPNVELNPPNTSAFLTVDLLKSSARVVTLGAQGEDEHTGVLQIGAFCPLQQGTATIAAIQQSLRQFYVPGTFLDHAGQVVQIEHFDASALVKDGSRFKCYFSVYYMARTQRALDNEIIQLLLQEYGGIPTFDQAVGRLTTATQL